MSDSLYVKMGDTVEALDLGTGGGGTAPEYVERIETLEAEALGVKADTVLAAQNAANLTSSPVYSDQTYGDPLALAFGKMMTRHAVGELWVGFSAAEKPAGVLLRDASLQSRGLYAALWQWAQDKRLVVTEAEWQAEYSANGVCHKYSDGDGSTTFRMPSAPLYIKGAANAGEAGAYVAEGLPDHTHTRGSMNITGDLTSDDYGWSNSTASSSGAIIAKNESRARFEGSYTNGVVYGFAFDASRSWTGSTSTANASNSIYGASSHVTPATSKLLFGVWAVSTAGVAVPDANAEEILAAVQRSADTDLSNLTSAGKEVAVKMSMPSSRYVDLTLGASGTSYTAPADGYVTYAGSISEFGRIHISVTEDNYGDSRYTESGQWCQTIIPVKAGCTFIFYYHGTATLNAFRFIYAEGAE